MTESLKKWTKLYQHLELDDDAMEYFAGDFQLSYYGSELELFKAMYYQGSVDINMIPLKAGDEVYYVFGTSLEKGVIESVEPFNAGYTVPRIKIKGKKRLVESFAIAKI